MSGPKSARYQLTPEQRKALEEERRRAIAREKGLTRLREVLASLDDCVTKLLPHTEKAKLLSETGRDDFGFTDTFSDYTADAAEIRKAATLAPNATLEEIESSLEVIEHKLCALKDKEARLFATADEIENDLKASTEEGIRQKMTVSFADLDEKKLRVERRIAARRELLLIEQAESASKATRRLAREALIALGEANDLSTFEALSLTPLREKAAREEKEYLAVKEEYHTLLREYRALCALIGTKPLETDCTVIGIDLLKRYINALRYEIAYDDEESYIGDVLNRVMREMGYHVLAERTVDKKSGKRFSHELYSYHDGTVVNVTTADDGKITMELGKPDTVDRLPTEQEIDTLCYEMEAFCRDFGEIEERLLRYGVVVAERIALLPPTAEYAQIINTEDYTDTPWREEESTEHKEDTLRSRLVHQRKVFRSHALTASADTEKKGKKDGNGN